MTKKSCHATVTGLCKKADLDKEECREITKKLCPRGLPELPSLLSIEEREEEEAKMETKKETDEEERRELTKRPRPVVFESVVPEFPRFPRMRTLPHMPTLAEGLIEPKKKHREVDSE
jgi:hypothetical protein